MQQITQIHIAKKFGPHAVGNTIDHFRSVVRWINMHAQRALTKGRIHNLDDGIRNFTDICVGNSGACETLHDFLAQGRTGARSVLGKTVGIAGLPSIGEVIRT